MDEQPKGERPPLTLTQAELVDLTRYKRAADQLRELHTRGFSRAYLRAGSVVLERPHFEAVCSGNSSPPRGRVKPPVVAGKRKVGSR
ncbi:hypothetical protein SAMN05216359_105338 [Roseateles sp. YR242]|uniref:hypothetical protein n=1 Tax=Roseateles sp. YR242 TaxID=1855305 RepID=UPI0008ACFCF4|nr:hypothetical protein [Roseateles sp. YR242]SEL13812.1 hypothetical protein SAMN05216359_105338 [Roseateles sp. YR242]